MRIEPAILYSDQVVIKMAKLVGKEYARYANVGCNAFSLSFSENDGSELQYVVIGEYGDVLGFIQCDIVRNAAKPYAENLMIVGFGANNISFIRGVFNFLCMLRDLYKLDQIVWSVDSRNKIKIHYDMFVKKYSGRVCGVIRGNMPDPYDGSVGDEIIYQLSLSNYTYKIPKGDN